MHARLGEVTYVLAQTTEDTGDRLKLLSNAMRHFCRSIELCDDYLRGFYGLKLATGRIIEALDNTTSKPAKSSTDAPGDLAPPSLDSVRKLNQKATAKLSEIVRRGSVHEKGWDGYKVSELNAARELLSKDAQSVQR